MRQDTIIVTFASPEQKDSFIKDCKIEESSIFMNEEVAIQIPVYFTADAEDSNLVENVSDGDPVEIEDEDFDLDDL